MSQLVLDAMDDASRWSAFTADGVPGSAELGLQDDRALVRYGLDATSGRITGTTAAAQHTLRRTLPATDLSPFDELRLWLRGDRAADGTPARPFFLELRLGSAALAPDAPANTWRRSLPLARTAEWELIRLSLADLSPQVRGAVTQLQIRCVDASQAFTCLVDDVLAVRDAVLGDVDAALLSRLHNRLTLTGAPVAAAFYVPEVSTSPSLPYIRVEHYDLRFAENASVTQVRTDFSGNGFALRPPSLRFELYYEVGAFASTRAEQAQMLEFVLRNVPPRGELIVNGVPLPVEWVPMEPIDQFGRRPERAFVHFKVVTRQELGIPEPAVPPFHQVLVEADHQGGRA